MTFWKDYDQALALCDRLALAAGKNGLWNDERCRAQDDLSRIRDTLFNCVVDDTPKEDKTMTKRDFALIATALNETRPLKLGQAASWMQWLSTTQTISRALADNNPRFNIEKFKEDCLGKIV